MVGSLFPSDLSKATAECLQRKMRMKSFHTKVTVCLADGEGAIRNAWARLLETCLDFNFCLIAQHLRMSCLTVGRVDSKDLQLLQNLELQGFASVRVWPVNGKVLAAKLTRRPSLPTTGGFVAQKTGGKFVALECSIIGIVQIQWHVMTDVTLISLLLAVLNPCVSFKSFSVSDGK